MLFGFAHAVDWKCSAGLHWRHGAT